MRKYLAEFLGTFMLVFLGTATVVIAKNVFRIFSRVFAGRLS